MAVAKKAQDRPLYVIERCGADPYSKSRADFFEQRWAEPGVTTGGRHPLNGASPLLDEPEGIEDVTDHAVAQFGDASRQVLQRQTEGKEPGILDLDAVIKDGEANRSALLSIVGVDYSVDERFANRDRRHTPILLPTKTPNLSAVQRVLLDERIGLGNGADEVCPNLGAIEDTAPVDALKSPGLDPLSGDGSR
jgi:hypothetical protein